ncbi:MAG: tRNA (adenosine(37)-N6)-threonylcarbamoyltransferase complex transferase subunit TsaD [Gemmatimonadota bacterium]|nr:tRNA (adenosine(37)-N6)-threonylcarbamoyltransferase complex transferase subunit TsaD [Gemmatimonadota bacterium]
MPSAGILPAIHLLSVEPPVLTLGIETSCDETSVALLEDENNLLSHRILSQMEHESFGGVVPELASRAHLRALLPLLESSLAQADRALSEVDLVGVAAGPGLIGSLLVGLCTAKALALALDKPLIGVNHLEAHLMANLLIESPPEPPFMALLASGGHTLLVEVKHWGDYLILGGTRDDAVGEAFDKVAKLLGLGYPGGPAIEKAATGADPGRFAFPRPMIRDKSLDMSFSGLKTAVLNEVVLLREAGPLDGLVPDLAASFQAAVVDVLADKSLRACDSAGVSTLVVAGGVARNRDLRERLAERGAPAGLEVVFPPLEFCTDNAAMIARTALFHYRRGRTDSLEIDAFPTGHLDWKHAG